MNIYSKTAVLGVLVAVGFLSSCAPIKQVFESRKGPRETALTTPQTVTELNRLVRPLESSLYSDHPEQAKRAVEQVNATYYFLLGSRLSNRGQTGDALATFDQLKKIDENSSQVYFFLAQELLKKGLMAEGVAAARKSLEIDPSNKETKIFLGNLFATAKKYSEASELFEQVIKSEPDNEDVMLYLALMETEQKQNDKAFQRISRFIASNPESALAHYYLGRLEQERGHVQAAIRAYAKAIDIRPGFVQAGTFLAYLQEESGDRKGAIENYAWLAVQTDDALYHKKLGHLLLDENEYEGALRSFENFERLDKSDLNNKVKIALVYIELKDFTKAIKKFEEVIKVTPDSENVRYYLAVVYEQSGDLAKALENYSKIPASAKLYPEAFRRKVFAQARLKKFDEGWTMVSNALKNVPIEGMSLEDVYEIGSRFLDEFDDKKDLSMSFIDQALSKHPQSERLLYLKGGVLERLDRHDEAIALMESVLKVNPRSAQALNFIAYSWAEKGVKLKQAEVYVRRALQLKPKDPFISDSLGWVLYQKGDFKQARAVLEEAFASRPDEAVIADHLGDVLVKLGLIEEAKKYYEIALKLAPSKEVDRKAVEEKLAKISALKEESSCQLSSTQPRCDQRVPDNSRTPASSGSSR